MISLFVDCDFNVKYVFRISHPVEIDTIIKIIIIFVTYILCHTDDKKSNYILFFLAFRIRNFVNIVIHIIEFTFSENVGEVFKNKIVLEQHFQQ